MHIDIKVEPESLSANLRHLALAVPIVMVIGAIQLALSDSPAWWYTVYADLRQVHSTDIVVGIFAGMVLLVLSKTVSLGFRNVPIEWVYKAFAAIPPSLRSIWLLSIFAAIFEELLFRAVLTPIVGVFGSAALFTITHAGLLFFAPSKSAALLVLADMFVFGLAMGLLYESFGLITCILAHLVYNVVGFHVSRPIWTKAHNEWCGERSSQHSEVVTGEG